MALLLTVWFLLQGQVGLATGDNPLGASLAALTCVDCDDDLVLQKQPGGSHFRFIDPDDWDDDDPDELLADFTILLWAPDPRALLAEPVALPQTAVSAPATPAFRTLLYVLLHLLN